MNNNLQNSNLIVRNGFYLAVRMLIVLFLAFFTTRITLQVLGAEKFGIYNIVGGIIALFAIISMPIRDSLQRFFNIEHGKGGDNENVVFFTSVRVVRQMIILISVLYETIGLFAINYVIKYPENEWLTVNIIFQMTVIANILNFSFLPYLAYLFSKENMGVPAMCEIISSIFKLLLLFIIPYIPVDILIPYTSIFLLTNGILYFFYKVYCKTKYSECFLYMKYDKTLQKSMLIFSKWSFIEAVAGITIIYVSNIFINIFGGILYNTAYGISKQLQDAVGSFSLNVLKASDPQIMSNTASNNNIYRDQLVLTTLKVSFLGVAFVSIVFHFDGLWLLKIWLGDVPCYVVEFSNVALLTVIFISMNLPLRTLIMATGKIRSYFMIYGIECTFIILLMFILLKLGSPVITVMYLIMSSSIIIFISGIIIVSKVSTISISVIIKNIFLLMMVLFFVITTYYITIEFIMFEGKLLHFCISVIASLLSLFISTYFIALNKVEKEKFNYILDKIIK